MQKRASYEWGVLWMLLSATMLSSSFFFLKLNIEQINYFFLLFLRFCIPFAITVLALCLFKVWSSLKTNFWLQFFRAFCVIVAQYGMAFYISKNTLLNATVLLNASPLFIPIIEWIFLKQRPGRSTIVGAVIAFFGVLLVLRPDGSLLAPMSLIGLTAAIAQAVSQVLFGLKPKSQSIISGLFYLFFFTTVISLVIFLAAEDIEHYPNLGFLNGFMVAAILAMGVSTLLNQLFRGLAYRCGRPSTLATFLYFSVFVSFCFDWFVFHNVPTTISIIGALLVLLGGVVKIFMRSRILKNKGKQK